MRYKELRALILRRWNIPQSATVEKILRRFSVAEKAIFYFLATAFAISGLTLLWQVNSLFLIEVPTRGGTLTEGIVGNPRFINPVLALSESDKNLSSLIYSGLVRITPENKIVDDLAQVSISRDRLTYTAMIKDGSSFHDGTPVTADDVVFTISKVTDPLIKSPRRGNWDGVTVEKVDERTVTFKLGRAYTPFIYNLTLGILPKHIWKNVSADEFSFSQFNTLSVGSGPYKVSRVERNDGGIPNFFTLTAAHDDIFIQTLVFKFYPSEEALWDAYSNKDIESLSGISPEEALEIRRESSRVISSPLPRVFAIFFNQSKSKALSNKEVRQALDISTPKEDIIKDVLKGFGTSITSPLPAGTYAWTASHSTKASRDESIEEAKEMLSKAGWTLNQETGVLEKKSGRDKITLSFSISTGDAPELRAVAETLENTWGQLGAKVEILTFETGDLNQNVIRPRNFDALLFGEVVSSSRGTDLYPFWHSSQRADPGLNIALYANSRADKLLDEARQAENFEAVEEYYKSFASEVTKDVPAVFLYTPSFLYILPEKVQAANMKSLAVSQDRFLGVRDWYIETDKVWKIFTK